MIPPLFLDRASADIDAPRSDSFCYKGEAGSLGVGVQTPASDKPRSRFWEKEPGVGFPNLVAWQTIRETVIDEVAVMVEEIRALDLFCGAGGSSRGLFSAGVRPVAAVDLWNKAIESYKANFPEAETFQQRLETLSPSTITNKVGSIDLLVASPECTNHSVAKGNQPRCEVSRNTAFQVVRYAEAMKPRWVIVENVTNMQRWHRFSDWKSSLEDLGYNVLVTSLSSEKFGVPQSRRRLFVLCDKEAKPQAPKVRIRPPRTAASILQDTDPDGNEWSYSPLYKKGRAPDTLARARRAMHHLGNDAPFLVVYYGSDQAGGWQSLDRPLRTITTLDRFALVRRNGRNREMRMLQPPELAAAMGFPEAHQWAKSTRREKIKMIGNAVCPPVMQAAVESLVGAGAPSRNLCCHGASA